MRRFAYTPDVNVYIASQEYGFIDASRDLIAGSVTRRINAVSNASVTLQNPHRKYLRKIKPMDRVVIYLRRIHQPVLVFSGYVDRAPYDQLFPGAVTITASCTLKRLLYTYWDPGLPFVQKWLSQYGWTYDPQSGSMIDPGNNLYNFDFSGGLGQLLRAVMKDVGGWDIGDAKKGRNSVHVMALPDPFIKRATKLLKNQIKEATANEELVERIVRQLTSANGVTGTHGVGTGATGTPSDPKIADTNADTDPLPVDLAKRHWKSAAFGEKLNVGNGPGGNLRAPAIAAANKYNVPVATFLGLIRLESNWHTDAVSGVGALGLTQGMPGTITGMGYSLSAFQSDPKVQLDFGANYLSTQYKTFGNWDLALAAYNTGPGNVQSHGGTLAGQIPEVRAYVDTVNSYARDETANLRGATDTKALGQIGDVKTSNPKFFTKIDQNTDVGSKAAAGKAQSLTSQSQGFTFRIKNNPFNEPTLIFRAVFSENVPADTLSIYIPGWQNKGTDWATNWKNPPLNLETSAGADNSFPPHGSSDTSAQASQTSKGSYVSPFSSLAGIVPERIDQGVDYAFTGTPEIRAIGNAKIIGITPNWYEGQPFLWYQLLDGDHKGEYIFVAEGINIVVQPGDFVKKGQKIAQYVANAHTGMETGFATATGQVIDPYNGRADGTSTDGGKRFARFLKSLGVPVRDDPGPGPGTSTTVDPTNASADGLGGTTTGGGTMGDSGVQYNQQDITSIATAAAFGMELGFPAVADVILSESLTGSRALANDVPLFEWIEFICKASGRAFQSMPNGDFLAFYPDYFNWSKTAPYFKISPIETIDLTVDIGDEELATHVFMTGDTFMDGQITYLDRLSSTVASVEEPAFSDVISMGSQFDSLAFLKRYGARPYAEDRPEIKNSLLQFMYGWQVFMEKWSKQFYCDAQFTFLPELFPGGLIDFSPTRDLVFYVQEVTHTFDRASGFSTSASLTAPSTKAGTNPGMVLTGGGLKNNPAPKATTPTVYLGPH